MKKSGESSRTILQCWTKCKALCLTTRLLGYAVAEQKELVVGALHGNLHLGEYCLSKRKDKALVQASRESIVSLMSKEFRLG